MCLVTSFCYINNPINVHGHILDFKAHGLDFKANRESLVFDTKACSSKPDAMVGGTW